MKISLEIKTNLEGIAVLKTGGIEHGFMIVLKCCNCGELSGEVTVSADEKESLNHSRGDTNLNIRCKFCSRENSLDIIPESFASYTMDDSGKFKTIVTFDCRGVEPVEFIPGPGWAVESEENGAKFEDVDLTEKEWVEYDEKNNQSVGIYDFESKFKKIK